MNFSASITTCLAVFVKKFGLLKLLGAKQEHIVLWLQHYGVLHFEESAKFRTLDKF